MSTHHKNAAVSSREDNKPEIILDYNKNKGRVDNLDKVTGTYTCQRMTARWPMAVFYNILDVSTYNAFVVWKAINPGWNARKTFKRRLFLEELGRALVTPHIERRQWIPRMPASANLTSRIHTNTPQTSRIHTNTPQTSRPHTNTPQTSRPHASRPSTTRACQRQAYLPHSSFHEARQDQASDAGENVPC
ncbi:hypothetical protein AAFF_G00350990 [Aldrovandia affinis]|uniref:PiggyBac transposable element-derived protein domain-containing protein n=1 Tax=Aldrovandia affinis TaxID=143900 RepID=A0AAD7SJM8_9TELE|nr:hypothetical protein AAFF_G00350990 [Aldrovandia affinis]